MPCCPKGIFSPLVYDCAGGTVPMPHGGLLRGDSLILGADILSVSSDTPLYYNAIVLVSAPSAAVTITLPPAAIGLQFVIKRIDSTIYNITIDADGSETIDGDLTKTLPSQYDAIHIVSDGTEWWII